MLAGVAYWGPPQDVNLIPLLAPLALLAYQGALCLRRGAAGALDWFGVLGFGFFARAGLAGLVRDAHRRAGARGEQLLQDRAGVRPRVQGASGCCSRSRSRSAGSTSCSSPRARRCAACCAGLRASCCSGACSPCCGCRGPTTRKATAAWRCSCAPRSRSARAAWCRNRSASRRPRRSTTMPASVRARSTSCSPNACPLMLVQGSPQHEFDGPGAGWVKLADVGRPGDRSERYRLYRSPTMNTRSPLECPAWAKLAQHAESWRSVHLRELFAADVTRRAAAQFAAEAPGRALRLLAPAPRRDDRAPAHAPRRRARLRRVARGAVRRQRDQHHRESRRLAHGLARRRWRPSGSEGHAGPHAGSWSTSFRSQKKYNRIVNLGTGGSDLGPRLVADALGDGALGRALRGQRRSRATSSARSKARSRRSTLFVVASKTFTTQETMANAERARQWGAKAFVAVTANTDSGARRSARAEVLPMWDWVGGRFSVWSAVGFAAACAIGFDRFAEFLQGARRDRRALRAGTAREERAGADGADRRVEHQLPRCADARGAALLQRAAPAARVPAAARDGIERQARRPRGPRGRLRDRAGAVGRRGHGEPALVPPAAAPGHAGGARRLHRSRPGEEPVGQLPRAGRRACVRHRRPGASAPIANIRATGPPACCPSRESNARNLGRLLAALRAQGVHPGRALEHQQLRPVGRGAGQGTGQEDPFRRAS